ncbi:MAG: glycosyltransferase [Bacteroidetes bacterium]|nr:glycosyltransferase [Bacteroidota bacterium]
MSDRHQQQTKSLKIAYLLGSLNRGGTETLLLDCFRNGDDADFPFIGIYRKDGVLTEDFKQTKVPLFHFVPQSKTDIGYLFRLRKLLMQEKITIVHAQQPLDALFAYFACYGTGIKIALTFHGYDMGMTKIEKALIRRIIRRTDLNIFVSNAQREYYQLHYLFPLSKSAIVHNGIAFDKMENKAQSTSIRNELQLSESALLFGSVGNFGDVRDQLTICKFIKLLAATGLDFHFVFVGRKNPAEAWRYDQCVDFCKGNRLDNRVHFLGSRTDVPAILHQLDAFLYATNHDSFGIAVLEAVASGIPVFVNDWNVMKEITEGGKYAHLYNTKDSQDLLREFELYLNNKEQYQTNAATAALWAKKQYSIQQHLQQLKSKYVAINQKPE